MKWEEIKSIIDKLVTIKCELKDVEYKLEFAWDDWVDYVDEDTIKVLEDGLKKRCDTLIKQQEECYSNIKDFVMDDTDDKKLTWDKNKVAFHLTCPCCGVHVRDSEDIVFEGLGAFNFCPNCGEDLREDKD